MVGEGQIGEVVVPDRVVQDERSIALPPGIAGPRVLLEDDRRDTEAAEAGAERHAALAAADDHAIGLNGGPERRLLCLPEIEPGPPVGRGAVLDAALARRPAALLMTLQLVERGEQRDGAVAGEPHMALAPSDRGLKGEPRLGQPARRRCLPVNSPGARLHGPERSAEHRTDAVVTFDRYDVPAERNQIAPVAFGREQPCRRPDVVLGEGCVEGR